MTIKEISKLAGVSTATVSYVLNNHEGRFSEEVKERVLRIVKENGYVPNRIAKSLREKRTNTIGILAEDITHFQTPSIVAGINNYVEQMDVHVVLNNLSLAKKIEEHTQKVVLYKREIEDAINILLNAQVDGIIYIGFQDRDVMDLVRPLDVPLVYAYCYSELDDRSWVSYDNESSMVEIIDKVLSLGHTRIAFVGGGDENCRPAQKRFNVYKQKLGAANISLRQDYIKYGDWSFEDGKRFYRELISLVSPPTAILSLNDVMAAGMIRESMNTDRRVLNEISIVGFNGFEFTDYIYPTLATVRLPLEEIGYKAAEQLVAEIQNNSCEHKHELLKCEFIDGNSLRASTN